MIPHDNLRWTYGQRNMIVWLKLFNHQGLVRTRVNVTIMDTHELRTCGQSQPWTGLSLDRYPGRTMIRLKNVEFKTIIHCQSRNKEGNSISQICFNLQVELRSTSRSNVTVRVPLDRPARTEQIRVEKLYFIIYLALDLNVLELPSKPARSK